MELSKGRWEVRNHGLPKDVAMMPPSGEEDVPLKSPAPKQGDEKKRKRVPNSPNSKKKKLKKRSRKPKGSTDTLSSDSIRRLRDESKEEEEEEKSQLVARVRVGVVMQGSSELADAEIGPFRHEEVDEGVLAEAHEPEGVEATPPPVKGVERDTRGDASRVEDGIPRDELGAIDITGSPQISDAMIREAGFGAAS
nr:uncharacterized protein LOC117280168 [Nicotiana tomentosiformis]